MTVERAEASARLTIAEAARAVGATPRALRYYEEIGLLAPSRPDGRIRAYDTTDVRTAGDIVEMRRLGLTMRDIATFLDNRTTDAVSRARLVDKLNLRLRSIAGQQAFLQTAITRLADCSRVTQR